MLGEIKRTSDNTSSNNVEEPKSPDTLRRMCNQANQENIRQGEGNTKEALESFRRVLVDLRMHNPQCQEIAAKAVREIDRQMSGKQGEASSSGSGSERHLDQEKPREINEQQERERQKIHFIKTHFESGYRYWQGRHFEEAVKCFTEVLKADSETYASS